MMKKLLMAAAILMLLASSLSLNAGLVSADPDWVGPVNISPGDSLTGNGSPQIAVDSNNHPHMVWQGSDGSHVRIWYSAYAGGAWSAPMAISSAAYDSSNPRIALDSNGCPHAVWQGSDGSHVRIWYSAYGGGAWSAPEAVSSASYDSSNPRMSLGSNGQPHVIWSQSNGSVNCIWYSTRGGGGWPAPDLVSSPTSNSQNAQLALDSGNQPHVVWEQYNGTYYLVCYSTGTAGTAWTSIDVLSRTDYNFNEPQIAMDSSGHAHVVWWGADTSVMRLRIFYTTGTSGAWSPLAVISSGSYESQHPQIALDASGRPHVAWIAWNSYYGHTMYSAFSGSAWSPAQALASNQRTCNDPRIALDPSGRAHIVWYEAVWNDANAPVYYADTTVGESPAPVIISTASVTNAGPQVAMGPDGQPHFCWNGTDGGGVQRAWYAADKIPRTVNVSTSGSGTAGPATQQVLDGDDATAIDIVPATGWHLASITDNGVPVAVTTSYTLTNVREDHDVAVTFSPETLVLTATAGPGGSITPAGEVACDYGSSRTFTIVPDEDYRVSDVLVDGVSVGAVTSYTFENITSSHAIEAFFEEDTFRWYLAEGATDGGMETWVLVANPGDAAVAVDLTLMTADGPLTPDALQGVEIPADSRVSFNLGEYVTSYDVATMVTSHGTNVVCERAVYGNSRTWGTDSVGATAPSRTWYLAEGCTAGGTGTYLLLQNPNPYQVRADISLSTTEGAASELEGYVIGAQSRATLYVNDYVESYDVSVAVTSHEGGIVCERAVYGEGSAWGHDSLGVTAPAGTWYLAEGATDGGIETWVLVANPGDTAVAVDLTLMTSDGPLAPEALKGVAIPAHSRRSFNLGDYVTTYDVSTLVTASGGGVVAERSMYGNGRAWGTCSLGAVSPASAWYLAEGCTGVGFETWVLVQNPGNSDVTVDLTFMTSGGEQPGPGGFTIPARSRHTFRVNDYVTDWNISTRVEATGGVVCERAMYGDGRTWAHDSTGYAP